MRPRGWSNERARERGVITSIINDVNGVAVKTTTMRVVAIRRDAITVVSARGTVDSRGLITSGARSRAWPRNDEGGQRIRNDTSRKRRRRRGGVFTTNAGYKEGGAVAGVPPSEILVPVAKAEDDEEGRGQWGSLPWRRRGLTHGG